MIMNVQGKIKEKHEKYKSVSWKVVVVSHDLIQGRKQIKIYV